jgi:hypothetical protein
MNTIKSEDTQNSFLEDQIKKAHAEMDSVRSGYARILALIGPAGAAHSMADLVFQIKEIKRIAEYYRGK